MADENIFVFIELCDSGNSINDVNSYDVFGRLAELQVQQIVRIGKNGGLLDSFCGSPLE